MRPVVITHPNALEGETIAVNALFEAGLAVLHLRKPAFREEELESFIKQISPQYREKIVLHTHLHLVEKYGLKGVHFTGYNRSHWDEYLAKEVGVSRSLHQLEEFSGVSERYSYVFLSPIFPSISKEGYVPRLSHATISDFLLKPRPMPVLCLGGVTPGNASQAKQMGFDGVAVLGYIWEAFKDDAQTAGVITRYKKICEQWEKAVQ
ncbi:thiamine phosphate synthase [Marinilabiliaceae bacterium JC017]|nr:thiamine phosphate synthase [Marinilabiliaceae bacterium JC017]